MQIYTGMITARLKNQMKMILIILSIICISCSGFAYGQDAPEWIPNEALECAFKEYGTHDSLVYNVDSLAYERYKDGEILPKWKLKNPYRVVWIDYENYIKGDAILKHIKMDSMYARKNDSTYYRETIGFQAYWQGTYGEDIQVTKTTDTWHMSHIGGIGDLTEVYKKYPLASGYFICTNYYPVRENIIFVVGNNSIVDAFIGKYDHEKQDCEFKRTDPITHMIEQNEKIKEWKKTARYKRLFQK